MNVILLGAPGSGKGTAAGALVKEFNLRHVSTGNIFREIIAKDTELGQKLDAILKDGNLVPDELTMEIVCQALKGETKGLLFDGFPRTITQAEGLDNFFKEEGRDITAVILLNVPEALVIERLSLRRSCPKCGRVYNLKGMPPKDGVHCDDDGSDLAIRKDDKPEVIQDRFKVYHEQTSPLIAYYKAKNILYEVDASIDAATTDKAIYSLLTEMAGKKQ